MKEIQIVIKPSDAVAWVSCARRAWLDNKLPATGQEELAAFDQFVIDLGKAHEQSVLAELAKRCEVATARSVADGRYQAADAKLSLNADKKEMQIQLGCYRRLLGNNLPTTAKMLGPG